MYHYAEVYCIYMDLRMFGRKYEDLQLKAQKVFEIRLIRGRVSEVSENIDKQLVIKAEDTLIGKPIKVTLDLLVLMAGMCNNKDGETIAQMIGIKNDEDGFFEHGESLYNLTHTQKDGVFYAGTCTGPKTLPESLNEGRAAAILINNYLKGRK